MTLESSPDATDNCVDAVLNNWVDWGAALPSCRKIGAKTKFTVGSDFSRDEYATNNRDISSGLKPLLQLVLTSAHQEMRPEELPKGKFNKALRRPI